MKYLLIILISFNLVSSEDIQKIAWEGKYDEAIKKYDQILHKEPENIKALDGKAETLSWKSRFRESAGIYEKRLKIKYDYEIARQKARVLGWGTFYTESINEYKDIYKKTKLEKIKLEMLAKRSWWNNSPLKAINYYHKLLKIEPDNIEARNDLSQIKANERKTKKALTIFKKESKEQYWNFRIKEGFEKLNTITIKPRIKNETLWINGLSIDRNTEIRNIQNSFIIDYPIYKDYRIGAGYGLDYYYYKNSSAIFNHYAGINTSLNFNGNIFIDGYFYRNFKTSDDLIDQKYKVNLTFNFLKPLIFAVFIESSSMNYNKEILLEKNNILSIGGNLRLNWHRFTYSLAEYKFDTITDDNSVNWVTIGQGFVFIPAPTELSLIAMIRYQDWNKSKNTYFSPEKFWNVPITLKWRQYLNKNGLYYGADNTYYEFRYQFQIDKGNIYYHGLGFEFHHDFNKKIGINYQAFGNYSKVYKDIIMIMGLTWYL